MTAPLYDFKQTHVEMVAINERLRSAIDAIRATLDRINTPAVAATAIEAPATAAQNPYRELRSDNPNLEPDGNNCSVCEKAIGNQLIDTDDQRVMGQAFIPVYGDGDVLYCETCVPVTA